MGFTGRSLSYVFALVLILSLMSLAAGARVDREDQAVSRASKFFTNVGWTANAIPAARAKVEHKGPSWSPDRWSVQFEGLSVDVDSANGRVRYASRGDVLSKRTKDIVKITKEYADKQAANYIKAMGLDIRDTRLLTSQAVTHFSQPGGMQWEVRYARIYKGYEFRHDHLSVDLDPLDGSLLGAGSGFDSPPPEDTTVNITKGQAACTARGYLMELGLTAGKVVSREITPSIGKRVPSGPQIVQPWDVYEYWEVRATPPDPAPVSRLAWVIVFDAPWSGTAVFVDAADGDILGGEYTNDRPKQEIFMSAIRAGVDAITVRSTDGQECRIAGSSADAKDIVKAIHALKWAEKSECQLPVLITMLTPKRTYTFGYSASDHRLVLQAKEYSGITIKGNLAWQTDEALEELMAKYIKS